MLVLVTLWLFEVMSVLTAPGRVVPPITAVPAAVKLPFALMVVVPVGFSMTSLAALGVRIVQSFDDPVIPVWASPYAADLPIVPAENVGAVAPNVMPAVAVSRPVAPSVLLNEPVVAEYLIS